MNSGSKKMVRPKIPYKTQLKIWVEAGGRCEFPGCNEFLLRDKLTFSEGNYSNIAHIISWTPTGPRGDKKLSCKLAADPSNLMLMCQAHAKQIDNKDNLSLYTVDFLKKHKEAHENRVRLQTDIDVSRKTTMVRLQANIRGRKVEVLRSEAYMALINGGRYPVDDKGIFVDLTDIDYSFEKSYWDASWNQIDRVIDRSLAVGNDEIKNTHLSIFGLAPIPLLFGFGYRLGNTMPADIYIKRREKPWSRESCQSKLKFKVKRTNTEKTSDVVGLSIAISGTPSIEEISQHIGTGVPLYEIALPKSQLDSICSIEDLELFRLTYRELIDEIRERHGKKVQIHLFGAIPTCVAVVCGREVLHGVDPQFVLYEYKSQEDGFIPALTIN